MVCHYTIAKSPAVVAVLGFIVGGCAGWPNAEYPVTVESPAGPGLIEFKDPAFARAKTVRVSHFDAFEHVEYARFESGDLTLEAVYDTALDDSLVLEYDYWMERMVDTWNANQGRAKIWGAKQTVRAWHGSVDYQPYRLGDGRQQCIGFSSEWNFQPRDSFGRPAAVLFGYVCANPGTTLSENRIATLLKSVRLSGRSSDFFVKPGTRRRVDQLAFNTAKGAEGSATGNAEFPFNFGTPYVGEFP